MESAAESAFVSWRKTTAKHRSVILEKWNDLILENAATLAEIMTLECGKPLKESLGEVTYGASFIKWFAEEGKRVYGDVIPPHTEDRHLVVIKQPIGVVALNMKWLGLTKELFLQKWPFLVALSFLEMVVKALNME